MTSVMFSIFVDFQALVIVGLAAIRIRKTIVLNCTGKESIVRHNRTKCGDRGENIPVTWEMREN